MAKLINAAELSNSVTDAVALASKRMALPGKQGKIVMRWELMGIIMRDLDIGSQFADAVTAELKTKGIAVEPAVLRVNRQIIAGFYERGNVPAIRELGL